MNAFGLNWDTSEVEMEWMYLELMLISTANRLFFDDSA